MPAQYRATAECFGCAQLQQIWNRKGIDVSQTPDQSAIRA